MMLLLVNLKNNNLNGLYDQGSLPYFINLTLKKKKKRDAQRLEVFYNRNQQLKEQNKTLQDTNDLLEGR